MTKISYKHHFIDTWKKSKDTFIKPKFRWYFGTWRKESNLPVWRRGPIIYLGRNRYVYKGNNGVNRLEADEYHCYIKEYEEHWNWAKLESCEWTEEGKKRHPIISKLFKPAYELPIWLAFHWYNDDIMYKTKWDEDDFRYEFPSHFTIVFFFFFLSITAYVPKENEDDWLCDDEYWESILTYQYYKGDLEKTNGACGWYNRPGEKGFRFKFNPRFLKNKEDRDKLKAIQDSMIPDIIEKYKKEEEERLENQLFAIQVTSSNVDDNKFDGWFCATYNGKKLLYESEEERNKAYENLKTNIKRKVQGVLKNIEYKKTFADKRYSLDWKTMNVNKSDLIDKNIDIAEHVYKG